MSIFGRFSEIPLPPFYVKWDSKNVEQNRIVIRGNEGNEVVTFTFDSARKLQNEIREFLGCLWVHYHISILSLDRRPIEFPMDSPPFLDTSLHRICCMTPHGHSTFRNQLACVEGMAATLDGSLVDFIDAFSRKFSVELRNILVEKALLLIMLDFLTKKR